VADLKTLKGVSEQDRKMIADAEALLGPEPSKMGFVKNIFWATCVTSWSFRIPKSAPKNRRCANSSWRGWMNTCATSIRDSDRSRAGDPRLGDQETV